MDRSMQDSYYYLTVFGTPDREASGDSDLFFKLPIGNLSKIPYLRRRPAGEAAEKRFSLSSGQLGQPDVHARPTPSWKRAVKNLGGSFLSCTGARRWSLVGALLNHSCELLDFR